MAISQPLSTDKQSSPDHSLMHRQIATDPSAPVKSLTVNASGNTIAAGTITATNLSGTNTGDQVADGSTITGSGKAGDPFVASSDIPRIVYTVASSTSIDKTKADYQCDGTDDDVQIQAAIDALPAIGGIIQLLDGQFNLGDTVHINVPGVWIRGVGQATDIRPADNLNKDMFDTDSSSTVYGVVFSDFFVNGNKDDQSSGRFYYDGAGSAEASDVHILRLFIYGMKGNAIEIDDCWGLVIIDTIIESCDGYALRINGGDDAKIIGCKFTEDLASVYIDAGTNIRIENCILEGSAGYPAVYDSASGFTTVIGCEFKSRTGMTDNVGIELASSYAIVANNNFYAPTDMIYGVKLTNGDYNIVENNMFVGASFTACIIADASSNYNSFLNNHFVISAGTTITDSGNNLFVGRLALNTVRNLEIRPGTGNTVRIGNGTNYLSIDATGIPTTANYVSNVATGTSPYACTSTTLNTNLNADLVDGIHGFGYTLQMACNASNPNDSTTYYVGAYPGYAASSTGSGILRVYVPKTGTIKAAYVNFTNGGTLGTTETSTINIRLNNTSDTIISESVINNALTTQVNKTDLAIAVSAGDYIELKWVTPAWATNPTNVFVSATVYIE